MSHGGHAAVVTFRDSEDVFRTFGTFTRRLWDVSPKTQNYETANSLVFQAHICCDKTKNN